MGEAQLKDMILVGRMKPEGRIVNFKKGGVKKALGEAAEIVFKSLEEGKTIDREDCQILLQHKHKSASAPFSFVKMDVRPSEYGPTPQYVLLDANNIPIAIFQDLATLNHIILAVNACEGIDRETMIWLAKFKVSTFLYASLMGLIGIRFKRVIKIFFSKPKG